MNNERETLRQGFPDSWRWIRIGRRIEGWLTDNEANALFELTRVRTPQRDPVVVELGSWLGKSSVLLAAGMRHKQNPRLVCVDPFGRDENPANHEQYYAPIISKMRRSLEEGFHRNIRRCGFSDMVCAKKGYSFEVVRSWTEPIDVLFIDASHDYEAVHRDVMEWAPFLKVGGTIALHDVSPHWPGPSRVMAEDLQPPYFEDVEQVDSLAWAVKRSGGPLPDGTGRTRIIIPKCDFDRRQREIARLTSELAADHEARAKTDALNGFHAPANEAGEAKPALGDLLRDTANQLADAKHAIADLRSSWSWRITAPLRYMLHGAKIRRRYADSADGLQTAGGETRKPPQSESSQDSRVAIKK